MEESDKRVLQYLENILMRKKGLAYWKKRALAAEKYINLSPCDPDIKNDQFKAYEEWQELVNIKSR